MESILFTGKKKDLEGTIYGKMNEKIRTIVYLYRRIVPIVHQIQWQNGYNQFSWQLGTGNFNIRYWVVVLRVLF